MIKLLMIGILLYVAYLFLFKKDKSNDNNKEIEDEMLECKTCGTFVSQKEAIIKNGEVYCSFECSK
jgi:uncharacterized protein